MSATGEDESSPSWFPSWDDDNDDFDSPLQDEDWTDEPDWSNRLEVEEAPQQSARKLHEDYFLDSDNEEDDRPNSFDQEDESHYVGEEFDLDDSSHQDFFKDFDREDWGNDFGEPFAGQLGAGGARGGFLGAPLDDDEPWPSFGEGHDDGPSNIAQFFGSSAMRGSPGRDSRGGMMATWRVAEAQGNITRHNDPLIPQGEVHFVSAKLQSPSDIRREGMWRRETNPKQIWIAEVLAQEDAPGRFGHHLCAKLFGESFAMRRANRGFLPLPWPVPHIWLTGSPGRMAKVSQMLDMRATDVKSLREFTGKRMYLGEWLAPDVYPLHVNVREGEERYLGHSLPELWHPLPPRLPSMGSPAAAAETPQLHTFSTSRHAAARGPQSDRQSGSGGLPHLAKPAMYALTLAKEAVERARVATPEQDMARKMAVSACEARQRADGLDHDGPSSKDFQQAAGKCIELQKICVNKQAERGDPTQKKTELRELLSRSVKMLCSDYNLSQAQALDMIEQAFTPTPSREPTPSLDPNLHSSAQKSMFDVWVQLALPGTDGGESKALEEQLRKFAMQVEHLKDEDERNELRSVLANVKARAHAALDLVLALADPHAHGGQDEAAEAAATPDVQRSRFHSGPQEIRCYETRMPVAAFQEADVRLYKDLVLNVLDLQAEGSAAEERQSETSSPYGEQYEDDYREAWQDEPEEQEDEGIEVEEASEAPSLQRQELSFHIPLQDNERMGCAGGARPIELGEVYPKELALALARHCATRPRHPAAAPALPSNLELEGCWITSDGGVGLQQMLSRVDPTAQAQAVGKRLLYADYIIEEEKKKEEKKKEDKKKSGARQMKSGTELADWLEQLKFQICRASLPEWSILTDLPILPPSLRAGIGERSDQGINKSYDEVLAQAEQLRIGAQERWSSRQLALQKKAFAVAVDRVIDMSRAPGRMSAYLKTVEDDSVAARIKGKPGRMRQNLLGKRVNYSCRSVIVSEPSLRLDEVGLPVEMALTLFDAFLFKEARDIEKYPYLKDFFEKKAFKQEFSAYVLKNLPFEEQTELLYGAIGDRRVFLNRQPSLHRLSMQAMSVRLFDGKAIRLHPLVCGPFNADFDGDTMVVHLALSDKAQEDLESMVPSANLFSPAHGGTAMSPSQDMVLGLYYMTADSDVEEHAAHPVSFSSPEAALDAWRRKSLPHTQHVRIPEEALRSVNESMAKQILGLPAKSDAGESDGDGTLTLSIGRLLFFMQLASGSGVAHTPGLDQREIEQYMDAV